MRKVLDVILCGSHGLIILSGRHLVAIGAGGKCSHGIHEDEMPVVCLQGVASVELRVWLLRCAPKAKESGQRSLFSFLFPSFEAALAKSTWAFVELKKDTSYYVACNDG